MSVATPPAHRSARTTILRTGRLDAPSMPVIGSTLPCPTAAAVVRPEAGLGHRARLKQHPRSTRVVSDLPHGPTGHAVNAGKQLCLGGAPAAAVVAHTGEEIAERQGALTLGAVRLVRVFSA